MAERIESTEHDRQLVDYLLGLLPEEEAERLEEATVIDDEVASRLSCIEEDLVDGYVAGTLDAALRAPFETTYLASPRRRAKVKFAKRFLAAVDRASDTDIRPRPVPCSDTDRVRSFVRAGQKTPAPLRTSRFSWPFVSAVASLFITMVVLANDWQLRTGLREAREQSAAVGGRAASLTRELENLQNARTRSAAAADPVPQPFENHEPSPAIAISAPSPAGTINSVTLQPQMRSIASVTTVNLPAHVMSVPLELSLESDDFARYQIALKNPATDVVMWRTTAARHASVVAVVLSAQLLASQTYALELSGIDSAGHVTPVASYAFRINRQ